MYLSSEAAPEALVEAGGLWFWRLDSDIYGHQAPASVL